MAQPPGAMHEPALSRFEDAMLRLLPQRCLLSVMFLGLALAATGQTGDPVKKLPIPETKAITKAEELVRDIFKDEIDKAKSPEALAKLAAYLQQQGDESNEDAAARYVLYRYTRDLAIKGGDAKLALGAVDKIATFFDVPALEFKAETLAKLVPQVPTKEPSKVLTELTLDLIAEALETDNYAAAVELGKVAVEAAKRAQVVTLVSAVQKRNDEIKLAQERFADLQPFVDRLKKDAGDAEANRKLGEYYAFVRGKWARALGLLAKAKADPLGDLARRDLAGPADSKDQLALADAWWDYAAKQPEKLQLRLQERAAYWYDRAAPGLSGLSRTKAVKRAEQVAARTRLDDVRPPVEGPVGFIKTLDGHTSEIRAVALSQDGRYGLSGSTDNSMRLWDLTTYKQVQTFKGHTKQVWDVAFVPNSKHVLSASWDATVKMWDMTTGKDIRTFQHPIDVNAVVASKDGRFMLTGCDDGHMRLWDLSKNEEAKKFPALESYCYACAFAPNGLHVAAGGKDRRAVVYERSTGKVVQRFEQNNAVLGVAFSPDSKYLFTCGDGEVYMWDIATGKKAKAFEGKGSYLVNSMGLSGDGRRLLTGGEDKMLRLWDVATGKEIVSYSGHTVAIIAVCISEDGRRALSGQQDGMIRCWGLPSR
jgi:WD40 repeat protein